MSRSIWVPSLGRGEDISAAKEHGTLKDPIFDHNFSPYDMRAQFDMLSKEVLPYAREDDLVLVAGPAVMVATVSSLFMREFGRVNFLLWNRHRKSYVEKTLSPGITES